MHKNKNHENQIPELTSTMEKILPSVKSMNYSIYSGNLEQINITDKTLISTINQYAYCVAEKDTEFREALQKSDILLPDGIGVVAGVKFLNGKTIHKIAGSDLHNYLLKQLNEKNGSCFYLGSSESTLQKIREKIKSQYPNIKAGTYSPPFKQSFSDDDNTKMINAVNNFQPDVLFVGMTAPKQEKWAYTHKDLLNAKLICSIGAAFDFYAGIIKRPGKFWLNMGLEWFVRLWKEPKRMSRRYLYYGPVFIVLLLKMKAKMILNKNSVVTK